MNKRFTTQSIFAVLLGVILLISWRDNPPNGNTGAPGDGICSQSGCHNPQDMSISGMVSISGLPGTIMGNTTYNITVSSSVSAGPATMAGFQIVVLDASNNDIGTMSNPGGGATISPSGGRTYCEHNGGPQSVPASWSFDWTSPAGPDGEFITMYAATNLVNNNFSRTGDRVLTTTVSGTLDAPAIPPNISIVSTVDVSCFGGDDGELTAQATSGTPPYDFLWSNGQTGPTAVNLTSGNYSVTVTDAALEKASTSGFVNQPPELLANIDNKKDLDCNGDGSGNATASGFGGSPGYTYRWSSGQTSQTVFNLDAGNYTVTVTDSKQCTATTSVTINEPEVLNAEITSSSAVKCSGEATGSATVNADGGSPGYSFEWDNGETSQTAVVLGPGDHNVTVTDINGCIATASVTIGEPDELIANLISTTDVECEGDENGEATVEVEGGSVPYSYLWPNGATTATVSNLAEGNHVVSITDNNDCTTTVSVDINQLDNEPPSVSLQNISVYLDSSGLAVVLANALDDGSSDNCGIASFDIETGTRLDSLILICDSLGMVPVTVTVTDLNGNSANANATVTVMDTIVPQITCQSDTTLVACTDTFFYDLPVVWDNCGASNPSLVSGLGSGSIFPSGTTMEVYEFIDAGGNRATCSFNVTVVNTLDVSASSTEIDCFGESTGTASASASGGTLPYNFEWNTGDTSSDINNLPAGTYSVTITDGAGCIAIENIDVQQADSIDFVVDTIVNASSGMMDGAVSVTVTGGTGIYTFLWSGPSGYTSTDEDITGIEAGNYNCTITDENGCEFICPVITVETTTSVNDPALTSKISIFPNPTKDMLHIKADLPVNLPVELEIYDLLGNRVYFEALKNNRSLNKSVSMNNLTSGIYHVRLNIGRDIVIRKIVLQKG